MKEVPMDTYDEVYQRSIKDPVGFWGEVAECVTWYKNGTRRKEMKRTSRVIPFLFVCFISRVAMGAQAEIPDPSCTSAARELAVKIDYGGMKPSRTVLIPAGEGKTVLELLQTVAHVETRTVAGYVFVTAIDGVEGRRGDMAWYYTIDGRAPGELAHTRILDGTEGAIQWIYKKDECSWTVDGYPREDEQRE
jgi:hypothetical protein